VNIKIRVCQIIGPAAAGSAGPVPTALKFKELSQGDHELLSRKRVQAKRVAMCSIFVITLANVRDRFW